MGTDKNYKAAEPSPGLATEAALSRVQRMAAIGTWQLDLDEGKLSWSDGIFPIFGLRPGEVEPTNELFFDLVHPDDRERIRAAVSDAVRTGRPYQLEHRAVLRDGRVRHVREHADVVRDPRTHRPVQLFGTAQDITDYVEAVRALRESETRFRATFEQAAVGMAHVDMEGKWVRVNQKLCDILGCDRAALLGMEVQRFLHPDDLPADLELARGMLSAGTPEFSLEKRCVRPDGACVWINLTVSVVADCAPHGGYFIAVVQDVSERRRAQDELKRVNGQLDARVQRRTASLRAALSDLETFSYTVSHDLRAPLRAMQGFAEILESRLAGKLEPEDEAMLKRIGRAASRMDRLTQDVLEFSRLSQQEAPCGRVELEPLLEGLIELNPSWKMARLEIERPLGAVTGSEPLLAQVLANLVGNALKFAEEGVTPLIRIRAEAAGGRRRLLIRDNGLGIDPSDHERIFRPFVRLAGSRAREGTGIGLAIVKKAVERMGGRVSVESERGKGSAFCIDLGDAP